MKKFWLALLVGAAAGGVAALLYAPQSGASTRKKLKRSLEDLGDSLEDAAEYVKDQAERLSKEANKLVELGKDRLDDVTDTANDYLKVAQGGVKKISKLV